MWEICRTLAASSKQKSVQVQQCLFLFIIFSITLQLMWVDKCYGQYNTQIKKMCTDFNKLH